MTSYDPPDQTERNRVRALLEADRRWPSPNSGLYEGLRSGFVLGADWIETHIWDQVGGILQTPPDGLSGDEYRQRVIELLIEKGAS